MTKELWRLSACELAEGIREKRFSCEAVMASVTERMAAHNPRFNAVVDDYTDEATWLDALYADFVPAVSLEDYAADNTPHFTHTVDGRGFWNRKLDYLFTTGSWVDGSAQTLQSAEVGGHETMPLSDHAPVMATLELP